MKSTTSDMILKIVVVIALVVILLSPNVAFTIKCLVALFGFGGLFAYCGGGHWCDRFESSPEAFKPGPVSPAAGPVFPAAGPAFPAAGPAFPASEPAFPTAEPAAYPGAIDHLDDGGEGRAYYDEAGAELNAGDNEAAPGGNPYNFSRDAAPTAAAACFDDEADADPLDGDERTAYQALSRNDPTRAEAGIMNRNRFMDVALREEVDETEGRVWWGRHED